MFIISSFSYCNENESIQAKSTFHLNENVTSLKERETKPNQKKNHSNPPRHKPPLIKDPLVIDAGLLIRARKELLDVEKADPAALGQGLGSEGFKMPRLGVEVALAVEPDRRAGGAWSAGSDGRAVVVAGEDPEVCEAWGFRGGGEAVVGLAVLAVTMAEASRGAGCGDTGGGLGREGVGVGEVVVDVRDLVGFGSEVGDLDEFFCVRSCEGAVPGPEKFGFSEWGEGRCVVVGGLGDGRVG